MNKGPPCAFFQLWYQSSACRHVWLYVWPQAIQDVQIKRELPTALHADVGGAFFKPIRVARVSVETKSIKRRGGWVSIGQWRVCTPH